MKINPKYGDKIITIPAGGVLEHLPEASREELAVLIFALANQSCTANDIKAGTGLCEKEIESALSRWKALGVLTYTGLKTKKTFDDKAAPQGKVPSRPDAHTEKRSPGENGAPAGGRVVILSSDLPSYTNAQISELLEKNKETKNLVDACQQALGKILKLHEIEIILKLYDFLNLDSDYILLLCSHCASRGKTTLRYIEKTAVELFDNGITEYRGLEKYFEYEDSARSMEGRLRSLFGMGERAVTKKERETFIKWAAWGYSFEIIEKAYETTVDSINKVSIRYTDKILENWHNAGYRTVEEIERGLNEYKNQKNKEKTGSFATDDFFEAALKRSYQD